MYVVVFTEKKRARGTDRSIRECRRKKKVRKGKKEQGIERKRMNSQDLGTVR